jgi:hypothetical protein
MARVLGAEKAVLEDVERDGEILVLADGRRLRVTNADGAELASIWLPPTPLTLRTAKRGGRLGVTNDDTGETVSATLTQ